LIWKVGLGRTTCARIVDDTSAKAFGSVDIFQERYTENATSSLNFIVEDLSQDIAPADQITLSSGVVSANSGGARSGTFSDNQVRSNEYNNTVDGTGAQGSTLITLTFQNPITALGFTHLRVNPNLLQLSVFEGAAEETFFVRENGRLGTFFGITTDTAFDSIRFTTIGGADQFDIASLTFAEAPTSAGPNTPVPLPASLPLLMVAVGGVFAMSGKARRKAGRK